MTTSYAVLQDLTVIPLIGANTLSTGDGLELSQRYGYDASKKPQSLTHRKRNTALTATLQTAFNPKLCNENGYTIFEYITELEGVCGKKVDLFWNGKEKGSLIVTSVDFSANTDTFSVFPEMAVSISLTEGYVSHPTPQTAVSTL